MYDKNQLTTLSTEALYQIFGGKDKRGATNAAIRYLDGKGFTRSQIAKMLDLRYQHVRNVLLTELKTKVEEVTDTDDRQIDMFE